MKKEKRQIIPQLNQVINQINKMNEQKLARKGTLKRKQQIRDLLSVIDNEDVEKLNKIFNIENPFDYIDMEEYMDNLDKNLTDWLDKHVNF